MIKEDNSIRRMDLALRSEYIGLETEIFQISTYQYVIFCKNYKGEFETISKNFNDSIRQIGTNVALVEEIPQNYLKRIEGISFSNVVDAFKHCCITMPDLETFITDKFSDVDIISISSPNLGINFELLIEVSKDTSKTKMDEIRQYLLDVDLGTDSIRIERVANDRVNEQTKSFAHPLLDSFNVIQLGIDKTLPFTIIEADYWFENAEKIYTGKFNKNQIPWYNDGSSKCFVDYSMFENVNLRNLLLLYDVVYILLPLDDSFEKFMYNQKISVKELLELVNMGKVIFMLSNLESRYNKKLLLEAYKCNPLSIIGRRGINSVVASHITETKNQYISHFPQAYDIASEIFDYGIQENNIDLQRMAKILSWPIRMSVDSFRILNMSGPIGYGDFGFSEIMLSSAEISTTQLDDLQFYIDLENSNVLAASALNSTYFPCFRKENGSIKSNALLGNLLGDFLKMFWYNAPTINSIEQISEQNKKEKHILSLFDCKENISIVKVANLADEYNTHKEFRDILLRLENLSEEKRRASIRQYNDLLFELSSTKAPVSKIDFLLGASSFLPLNYFVSLFLASFGILKGRLSSLKAVERSNELRIIEKCINNANLQVTRSLNEDIYLLDKISRVAYLR